MSRAERVCDDCDCVYVMGGVLILYSNVCKYVVVACAKHAALLYRSVLIERLAIEQSTQHVQRRHRLIVRHLHHTHHNNTMTHRAYISTHASHIYTSSHACVYHMSRIINFQKRETVRSARHTRRRAVHTPHRFVCSVECNLSRPFQCRRPCTTTEPVTHVVVCTCV